ncbi:hypothetical protein Bpfe_016811, partial [Biomphalaria pfeifferi]
MVWTVYLQWSYRQHETTCFRLLSLIVRFLTGRYVDTLSFLEIFILGGETAEFQQA